MLLGGMEQVNEIREMLKRVYDRSLAFGLDKAEVDDFIYKVDNNEIILLNYIGKEETLLVPDWFDAVEEDVSINEDCVFSVRQVFFTERVKRIGARAFCTWFNLTSISAPGVQVVEKSAFSSLEVLVEVEMPALKVVKRRAFEDCICLSEITTNNVEFLGVSALSNTSLRSIDLTSLVVAGRECLANNHVLKTVKLPNRKFEANAGMFKNCTNLENVL